MTKKTQTEFQQEIDERFAKHEAMFDKIMAELQKLTTNQDQRMVGPSGFASGGIKPYLKLHFPRFGGEDPKGWLYQAEQYFEFQRVETEDQVQLASFHLDGIALQWHRWITKFRGPMTWAEFSKAVLVRFGPTEYEDPAEALSRLKQTTTVASYQEAFEKNLPSSGWVTGDILEAIGMALLVEEKLNLQRRGSTSQRFLALTAPSRSTTTQGILDPSPNQRLAIPAPNPIRRLSQTEALERREKGLCYYCDERYTPGHKCSKPPLFMISDVSEVEYEESLGNNQEQNPGDSHVEILFHAISDGGSTHNFVDQALVDRFGLVVEKDTPLKVVVGNREHVTCTGRVRALTIVIQGYVISTDFFVLPIAACPIVLEVQWLKTLGPVEMDYEQLTRGFHLAGSSHKLQGLKGSELAALKTHELMGIQGTTLLL
ncbi:putative unclassified retrotransposon protein [Tanacetum coccineum]